MPEYAPDFEADIAAGFSFIPIGKGTKIPVKKWKTLEGGNDPEIVRGWLKKHGLAVDTEKSGVVVLDFDIHKVPEDLKPLALEKIEYYVKLGGNSASTPSGGTHVYFNAVEDEVKSRSLHRAPGFSLKGLPPWVELKAVGGQAVAYPRTGKPGVLPWSIIDVVLEDIPAAKYAGRVLDEATIILRSRNEGPSDRNDTLFKQAILCFKSPLDNEMVTERLTSVALEIGLEEEETEATLNSAQTAVAEDGGKKEAPTISDLFLIKYPDVVYYGDEVFSHSAPGLWLEWKDERWEIVPHQTMIARLYLIVSARFKSDIGAQAALRTAYSTLAHRIWKGPKEALFLPCGRILDATGQCIDLKLGQIVPHERERPVISRLATAAGLKKKCPIWDACINYWMAEDQALVAYIRRLCGYALLDSNPQHLFLFLTGRGSNGKSTFQNVVREVFGVECATGVNSSPYMKGPNIGEQRTELAPLEGNRIVFMSEVYEKGTFDAAKLKSVTGEPWIEIRNKYDRKGHSIPVTWLLVGSGQGMPKLTEGEEAWRRRIRVLRFTRVVPQAMRDTELNEKLRKEHPAILNWMLEGLRDYLANGECPPEQVLHESQAALTKTPDVGAFISAVARWEKGSAAKIKDLYNLWIDYLEDENAVLLDNDDDRSRAKRQFKLSEFRNSLINVFGGSSLGKIDRVECLLDHLILRSDIKEIAPSSKSPPTEVYADDFEGM